MKTPPLKTDKIMANGIVFTYQDIYTVIDDFYSKVQNDSLLKEPFSSVHDWPEHILRLTQFWWIRFGGKPYMFSEYNPVLKHFHAGFNAERLERWLELFHETLKTKLTEEQAKLWMFISEKMGQGLYIRNEMLIKHHAEKKSKIDE